MPDFDLDDDLDLDELPDLGPADAAELEETLAALDREGGVEAAFQAALREELGGAW